MLALIAMPSLEFGPTCEHGRLDELHQLVNLDEDGDRHFQLGAVLAISGWNAAAAGHEQYLQQIIRLLVSLSQEA
jgi:hypothetical protein